MGRGSAIEADRPLSPIDVKIQRVWTWRPVLFKFQGVTTVPAEGAGTLFTDESSRRAGPSRGKDGPIDAFGVTDRDHRGGEVQSGPTPPGFLDLPGVRVACVCNFRRETAARVAREFSIPKVYSRGSTWSRTTQVNAIVIGTWPNMHCPATLRGVRRRQARADADGWP